MNKKTLRRQRDLKTKLMAAISMLLVSSLMMVTSTYAWFTLSTAPEVTGITTAVGANGNLEMALLPESGLTSDITSEVGDSNKEVSLKNVTWGNLVDLSDNATYGMDKITLYPSQLNATLDEATKNPNTIPKTGILSIPTYGADGRIDELKPDTVTSTYEENSFPTNNYYGVRAIGTASGMTDRQLAYRNARTYATTAMAQAKDAAANSLSTNGNALANIAITHGTDSTAKHTQADVTALLAIVNDLLGTSQQTGVLEYIEEAYIQYIVAYGASQKGVDAGLDDIKFNAYKNMLESAEGLNEAVESLADYQITLQTEVSGYIVELTKTKTKVTLAKEKLEALKTTTEYLNNELTWTQIYGPLSLLADTDAMTINGIAAENIKNDESINHLVQTIGGGLTVTMATGGGVYADIADHCGDYSASIVIKEINYGSLSVTNLNARMTTDTSKNPVNLVALGTAVSSAESPKADGQTSMPITEMYGYIIDLAFRTNAAESELLLQQDAIDRIYDENGNEDTMGSGSSMTFAATTTDFSDQQVKDLMKAIRVIFVQPSGTNSELYDVVATAKLDTANATKGADGITAKMYLYELAAAGEDVYEQATYDSTSGVEYYVVVSNDVYAEAEGVDSTTFDSLKGDLYIKEEGENYTSVANGTFDSTKTYYTKSTQEDYTKLTGEPAAGVQVYTKKTATAGETVLTDNKIMPLVQNTAAQLSVLVYLDGNYVTNKDVAATAGTSVTGTMNLQFASSANLVPMEYADLHVPVTETALNAITVTDAESNGVLATGSYVNDKVTIKLTNVTDGNTVTGVSVGGTLLETTAYTYEDGTLTFTQTNIAADTAIVITIGTETATS